MVDIGFYAGDYILSPSKFLMQDSCEETRLASDSAADFKIHVLWVHQKYWP